MNILQVNAIARRLQDEQGSVSTRLANELSAGLRAASPNATLTVRDLAVTPQPLLDEAALGGARKSEQFREESKKFFVNYFKQVAVVFTAAWQGRKYSIRTAPALRAFIRVAPDVARRLDQEHADRTDFRAIGRVLSPWGRRIGDLRFETDGQWKRGGTTVDSLAKELKLALQYPEGADL